MHTHFEIPRGIPERIDAIAAKTVATDHRVRYIEIVVPAHVRTGRGGNRCDGRLRLITNLMHVPAELISEAYRLRWLIELFFRMMNQCLVVVTC